MLKRVSRPKNQILQTTNNSKFILNLQSDGDLKKRSKTSQKSNVMTFDSRPKNHHYDDLNFNSKPRRRAIHSRKDFLENFHEKSISNVETFQNLKDEKKQFADKSGILYNGADEEKMRTKSNMTKQKHLFEMDIDSIGISNLNDVQSVVRGNEFQMRNLHIENKKYEHTFHPKPHLNDQKILTSKSRGQDNIMTTDDRVKKHEHACFTVKHTNLFEIDNKLKFE